MLSAYIFVDIRDRDIGGCVADAQKAVREQVKFPPGYYATWSGQFEYMERAKERLTIVVPLTIVIVFVLLYMNFRRLTETLIVMLSVPFALVGGVWLMYLLGYSLSVAAETRVVMLIYLDHAMEAAKVRRDEAGERVTIDDLYDAVMQGAVYRVRPLMMPVIAIIAGLLPIMWGHGHQVRGDAAHCCPDGERHGVRQRS